MSDAMRATLLERLRQFQDYLFEKYGEMPSGVEEINQMRNERGAQIAACADANAIDTLYGRYSDQVATTDPSQTTGDSLDHHTAN